MSAPDSAEFSTSQLDTETMAILVREVDDIELANFIVDAQWDLDNARAEGTERDCKYFETEVRVYQAEAARRRQYHLSKPSPDLGFDPRFLADLKARTDLVALIESDGVTLRRSGKSYRGRCPLHDGESDNSLTVWPDSGRWRCWGCQTRSGDAIAWLMAMHRIEFRPAVFELAARAGMPIPVKVRRS